MENGVVTELVGLHREEVGPKRRDIDTFGLARLESNTGTRGITRLELLRPPNLVISL